MLLILNLCHNSFSSFRQLCKYIKYRITGSVSHIAIENANLLELRALERKFQFRASLCNVQGFQKIPTLCSLPALCICRLHSKIYQEVRRLTQLYSQASTVANLFSMLVANGDDGTARPDKMGVPLLSDPEVYKV